MTQDEIRNRLKEVERRFAELDLERTAALSDGDLERIEVIAEEQEQLFQRGERLRGRLRRPAW